MKDKIIYIYDTLCGWCHVASPVITRIQDYSIENSIIFEHYHSRLFIEENVPMMNTDFIEKIKRVGKELAPKMTGITFSDEYIELCSSDEILYESHLTSIGVAASKLIDDDVKAFKYAKNSFRQNLNKV